MIINPLLAAAIAVPATGVFVKYMNNKNKNSELNYPSFDTSSISAEPSAELSLTTTNPEETSFEPSLTTTNPEETSLEQNVNQEPSLEPTIIQETNIPQENANIKVGGRKKRKSKRRKSNKRRKSKRRKSNKKKKT